MEIEKVEKVVPNLDDQKEYVIQIKNLILIWVTILGACFGVWVRGGVTSA